MQHFQRVCIRHSSLWQQDRGHSGRLLWLEQPCGPCCDEGTALRSTRCQNGKRVHYEHGHKSDNAPMLLYNIALRSLNQGPARPVCPSQMLSGHPFGQHTQKCLHYASMHNKVSCIQEEAQCKYPLVVKPSGLSMRHSSAGGVQIACYISCSSA